MALLNGQTPEEIAAEVMEKLEDRVIEISGSGYKALVDLTRYDNRETIAARGEKWFDKNQDHLIKVCLGSILTKKNETIQAYLVERNIQQSWDLFRTLVSRGIPQEDAMRDSFPNGIPAPKKKGK